MKSSKTPVTSGQAKKPFSMRKQPKAKAPMSTFDELRHKGRGYLQPKKAGE